jgi:hypothetical protein
MLLGVVAVVVAFVCVGALPAFAISLTYSPNMRIPNYASRNIVDYWSGGTGHYKVSFTCGNPGCSDWSNSNTTIMALTRTGLHYADCNGGQALSLVTVWDQAGAGTKLTGLTTTTWYRSGIC